MKDIIDMSKERGYFIDQSQSLNLFLEGATMAKLTSMHFYAWKSGLKTGMYYLRTKSAVDAIKFTLDTKSSTETKKDTEPKAEVVEPKVEVEVEVKSEVVASKKKTAEKTAKKFAETKDVDVQPMTPDEMKQLIAQSKDGQGDDCLMCGS